MDELLTKLQPHAGRWVALTTDHQVAGSGDTGPAALRDARPWEAQAELTARYVPDLSGRQLALSPLLQKLEPQFAAIDMPIYLVGGAVRDAVLGHVSHDLDFAVPAKGIKTAFRIGDGLGQPAYALDKARDTGRVMLAEAGTYLDFVAFRGPDLPADLYDRDLTINALAIPVLARTTAEIIDPTGGLHDLQAGIIRPVHDQSLVSDPVRGLRVVRLAVRLDFTLDPAAEPLVRDALQQLDRPSVERVRDELINLVRSRPHLGLPLLHRLGGLMPILPEIARLDGLAQSAPHTTPVLDHTWLLLAVLDDVVDGWLAANPVWAAGLQAHLNRPVDGGLSGWDTLRLGGLFHDVGKGLTQTVDESGDGRIRFLGHDTAGAELVVERLTDLRFSRETIRHVKEIVRGHMRPLLLAGEPELTPRAVHRFWRQTGRAGLDIALLALADHLATYGPERGRTRPEWARLNEVVRALIDHFFRLVAETKKPDPLLKGSDLISELGLEPGPLIGRLLLQLEEAQVAGEISTPGEALGLARKLVSQFPG